MIYQLVKISYQLRLDSTCRTLAICAMGVCAFVCDLNRMGDVCVCVCVCLGMTAKLREVCVPVGEGRST
jgi:hypothetical protein